MRCSSSSDTGGAAAAGAGKIQVAGAVVRTEWSTPTIRLRREFDLPAGRANDLHLYLHHDEDAQVLFQRRAGGFARRLLHRIRNAAIDARRQGRRQTRPQRPRRAMPANRRRAIHRRGLRGPSAGSTAVKRAPASRFAKCEDTGRATRCLERVWFQHRFGPIHLRLFSICVPPLRGFGNGAGVKVRPRRELIRPHAR